MKFRGTDFGSALASDNMFRQGLSHRVPGI